MPLVSDQIPIPQRTPSTKGSKMTLSKSSFHLMSLSFLALALSGCAISRPQVADLQPAATTIRGQIHGGQQPIQNATVGVYAVGTSGYGSSNAALATTTSDAYGNFAFSAGDYACPQADTPMYLLASGGNPGAGTNPSVVLAASLGTCTQAKSASVNINEVTTVATAYALAQFFTNTLGTSSTDSFGGPSSTNAGVVTYSKGLVAANTYTVPTLVNIGNGTASPASASVTVEATKIYTIANILAACVNSTGATSAIETITPCGKLFAATLPPSASTRPSDTLQAAVQMARYPYQNVSALFNLAASTPPFAPSLASVNDWTLGVKYSSSAFSLTVTNGTTSNLDIDADGNIWLPTTTPAGVAMFSPSANTFSGPFLNASLNHPQNIAINSTGIVYAADLGSSLLAAFNPNGSSAGSYSALQSLQGTLAIGPSDQIWITTSNGFSGNTVITELSGGSLSNSQTSLLTGTNTTTHYATGITVMPNNDVYLATSDFGSGYMESFVPPSSGQPPVDSIAASFGSSSFGQIAQNGSDLVLTGSANNTLCSLSLACGGAGDAGMNNPQGVATDGDNNIWIANSGSASVSAISGSANSYAPFSSFAYLHDSANGNTSVAPYGIGIDASGNIWVSNQTNLSDPYVLTEIIGAAAPTITPLSAQIAGGVNLVGTRPTN